MFRSNSSIQLKTSYTYCKTLILRTLCTSSEPLKQPLKQTKLRSNRRHENIFVDFKNIVVQGGKGGSGTVAFLRLFANEFAGPSGGDGGNGGHVILKASTDKNCLAHISKITIAEDGGDGKSKSMHGRNAEHVIYNVPLGTLVKGEDGKLLYDLEHEGDIYIAAKGGGGGHGNAFYISNEVRAPTTYEIGAAGEERKLNLELSVIAHVGLVGFPNAGKSTLLRAVSRARPKVAAYPFTTLKPHIGMIQYQDHEQVAVADIPGIIRGAHLNQGLGLDFLRHIYRCSCLLYVLDLSADDPWRQFNALRYELEMYEEGLSQKPHAIVANKIDLNMADKNLTILKEKLQYDETIDFESLQFFPVSAKFGTNIQDLLVHVRQLHDKYKYAGK